MCRLREGRANTARGAAHFLRETVGRVRYGGASGQCGPTAASTPIAWYPSAASWTCASPSPAQKPAEPDRGHTQGGLDVHPILDGRRRRCGRGVSPAPRRCGSSSGGCSQLALFATYSYHGFITDRDGEMLELEADHRRHAEIENAIRDLKYGVGLNHMPSGRFAANAAWLAIQVMAHNLARWTARTGLGEQVVTTKTLRRVLLPRRTNHPLGPPPHPASSPALALGNESRPRLRAIPLPT